MDRLSSSLSSSCPKTSSVVYPHFGIKSSFIYISLSLSQMLDCPSMLLSCPFSELNKSWRDRGDIPHGPLSCVALSLRRRLCCCDEASQIRPETICRTGPSVLWALFPSVSYILAFINAESIIDRLINDYGLPNFFLVDESIEFGDLACYGIFH